MLLVAIAHLFAFLMLMVGVEWALAMLVLGWVAAALLFLFG
jgi:hypothetical protein